MDTKQIEYILKIAEENNITKAAEKLFITQSALNQQLLKLEKELGTPLFYRTRSHWHLTEAGQIYIRGAKEAIKIKNVTYNQIYDVTQAKKGTLNIGLTPGRGLKLFTAVYPQLHRDFPNLNICPIEMRVRAQQEAIAKGIIDIGFMTLRPQDQTNDEYIILGQEKLMLIIPSGHPVAERSKAHRSRIETISLKELRYEPFVLMDKDSTLRSVCDCAFQKAGFSPHILFETNNTGGIASMVEATLCCGIIPWYYVRHPSKKLTRFYLDETPSWDIAISYSKSNYLNSGAREFISLAQEWWNTI
jgi:DNA-binding transcriptional LysR family regulator